MLSLRGSRIVKCYTCAVAWVTALYRKIISAYRIAYHIIPVRLALEIPNAVEISVNFRHFNSFPMDSSKGSAGKRK
jgi:hypothetical protein